MNFDHVSYHPFLKVLRGNKRLQKGRKGKLAKPKESDSSDTDSSMNFFSDSDEIGSSPILSSSDESLPEEIEPTNIDPRLEMYYAVYYDLDWYVGRVVDFPDEGLCKVKFLQKVLNNFKWPVHDDIQTVSNKFLFYGPINLDGNGPFTISRGQLNKIKLVYNKVKKGL